ncbi:hypothetical protein MEN95_26640, partial [Dolichospermum sp. ST_sed7]|nr:hypothetical protein [Dolichospermum sp. ST_sed7]
ADRPYPNIVDETNAPNDYQGSLRFGYLTVDVLEEAVRRDFEQFDNHIEAEKNLIVTCIDQLGDTVTFFDEGVEMNFPIPSFEKYIGERVKACVQFNESAITPTISF